MRGKVIYFPLRQEENGILNAVINLNWENHAFLWIMDIDNLGNKIENCILKSNRDFLHGKLSEWECVHVCVCVCVCVCVRTQSCPTLCYPMCCNLPGSSVHGIFQAKLLKWFPTPGDFADPGIEPNSFGSPELAGRFFYHPSIWEVLRVGDLIIFTCKLLNLNIHNKCHIKKKFFNLTIKKIAAQNY